VAGYVVPLMLLGLLFLALAGLLNGNGPRVAQGVAAVSVAVALVFSLVGR
jgi:hypothetical protein